MTAVPVDRWDLVHLLLTAREAPRSGRDAADLDGVVTRAVAALRRQPPPPAGTLPASATAPLVVEGRAGPVFEANSWLLVRDGACVVVDVPPEPWPVVERIRELGVVPVAIVVTHGHLDHAGGVGPLLDALPVAVPVHVGVGDRRRVLEPGTGPLARVLGTCHPPPPGCLVEPAPIVLGDVVLRPLATPGHTPGSTCWVVAGTARPLVLTGDVLFAGGTGRCDLPGARRDVAQRSLAALVESLPDDAVVLPGHGPVTTVGAERPRVAPAR